MDADLLTNSPWDLSPAPPFMYHKEHYSRIKGAAEPPRFRHVFKRERWSETHCLIAFLFETTSHFVGLSKPLGIQYPRRLPCRLGGTLFNYDIHREYGEIFFWMVPNDTKPTDFSKKTKKTQGRPGCHEERYGSHPGWVAAPKIT